MLLLLSTSYMRPDTSASHGPGTLPGTSHAFQSLLLDRDAFPRTQAQRGEVLCPSHTQLRAGRASRCAVVSPQALVLSVHPIKLPLEKQSHQLLMTSLTFSLRYRDASRVSLNSSKSQNRVLCQRKGGQGKSYRSLGNVFLSNC